MIYHFKTPWIMKYLLTTTATVLIIILVSIAYLSIDYWLGNWAIIAVGVAVIALFYFIYRKIKTKY